MTDNSSADNLNPDPRHSELIEEEAFVQAVFIGPPRRVTSDPYDLGELFVDWAWSGGYREWNDGVRALARALRGLAEAGLIERRTIRRVSGPDTSRVRADGRRTGGDASAFWRLDRRRPGGAK